MTTRIEKDFVFQAAVYFEKTFLLNIYDLKLSMLVETDSVREQNIAMERMHYILEECLENCVFLNETEKDKICDFQKTGIKVCTIPEEPYDQILSLIVLLKLNAVMEGKLYITDLVLSSKLSSGVRFNAVTEVAENLFSGNYWYNKNTTEINDLSVENKKQKIVKLFNDENWDSIGLVWKEKSKSSKKKVTEPNNNT